MCLCVGPSAIGAAALNITASPAPQRPLQSRLPLHFHSICEQCFDRTGNRTDLPPDLFSRLRGWDLWTITAHCPAALRLVAIYRYRYRHPSRATGDFRGLWPSSIMSETINAGVGDAGQHNRSGTMSGLGSSAGVRVRRGTDTPGPGITVLPAAIFMFSRRFVTLRVRKIDILPSVRIFMPTTNGLIFFFNFIKYDTFACVEFHPRDSDFLKKVKIAQQDFAI